MHPRVLSKQGWSTIRRMVADGITDTWTLAGGTAFALQIGHRYSEDVDFFRTESFDVGELIARLARIGHIQVQSRTGDTLHARVSGLRISFSKPKRRCCFRRSSIAGSCWRTRGTSG